MAKHTIQSLREAVLTALTDKKAARRAIAREENKVGGEATTTQKAALRDADRRIGHYEKLLAEAEAVQDAERRAPVFGGNRPAEVRFYPLNGIPRRDYSALEIPAFLRRRA